MTTELTLNKKYKVVRSNHYFTNKLGILSGQILTLTEFYLERLEKHGHLITLSLNTGKEQT